MTATDQERRPDSTLTALLVATLGPAASHLRSRPELSHYAFFFDLDGTLAPIAATPEAACIPPATLDTLARLQDATGDALAVVSGRSAAVIDALLAPLRLAASGLHGAQWRAPGGPLRQLRLDPQRLAALAAGLAAIAQRHPGLRLEDKGLSFAVHYRQAPALERAVHREVALAAEPFHDVFELQHGKMVIEVKPRGVDKGQAVARFMQVAPFRGRVPVFAGDDATDETAFQVVGGMDGVAIKIGTGPTSAPCRLPDPHALRAWLDRLLAGRAPAESSLEGS